MLLFKAPPCQIFQCTKKKQQTILCFLPGFAFTSPFCGQKAKQIKKKTVHLDQLHCDSGIWMLSAFKNKINTFNLPFSFFFKKNLKAEVGRPWQAKNHWHKIVFSQLRALQMHRKSKSQNSLTTPTSVQIILA